MESVGNGGWGGYGEGSLSHVLGVCITQTVCCALPCAIPGHPRPPILLPCPILPPPRCPPHPQPPTHMALLPTHLPPQLSKLQAAVRQSDLHASMDLEHNVRVLAHEPADDDEVPLHLGQSCVVERCERWHVACGSAWCSHCCELWRVSTCSAASLRLSSRNSSCSKK